MRLELCVIMANSRSRERKERKSRMDRDSFTLWCLLGIAVALAVFFTLGAKRRACIPPLVWWLCLILGRVTCMFGLSHSTAPSFAARITAIGKAYDHVERKRGSDTYYGFRFVPDGEEPVNIETQIILPDWDFRWTHLSRCVSPRQQKDPKKRSN